MPTLEKRIEDGGYYIRDFVRGEYRTWQVQGEGVRILARRGITEGKRFSKDLFMELVTKGLVYHGDSIPSEERKPCTDSAVIADFERRVTEFCRLIYARDITAACNMVALPTILEDDETPEVAADRFANEMRRVELASWRLSDVRISDGPFEVLGPDKNPTFRATKIGVAYVAVKSKGYSIYPEEREIKQFWVYSEEKWLLMLHGFEAAA